MTRSEQVARLAPYVRDLADRMCLKDWTINLPDRYADQDNNAEIHAVEGQRWANIALGYDFFDKPPEEQRAVLCHELIHCHFDMAARIGEREMDELRRADFRLAIEYGVDDMARSIAPHMPLPPTDEAPARSPRRKK